MSNDKRTKQYDLITDDDMVEIEEVYPAEYYNQEILLEIIKNDSETLHKARLWGWNDTEVGDMVQEAVTKLGVEFEKHNRHHRMR